MHIRRASAWLTLLVLLLLLVAPAGPAPWLERHAAAATTTVPSNTSVTSMYLSNWVDLQAIWMDSKLSQTDTAKYGPRIAELRYQPNMSVNQINDWSSFFRDETNTRKYNDAKLFDGEGWFESDGHFHSNFVTYNGVGLPVQVNRDYVLVPNQPFLVARYRITNPNSTSITWNLLDMLHVNNTQKSSGINHHGWYDSARNALVVDMSASGQYFLALGALEAMDGYQVGNDQNADPNSASSSPWVQFDATGTLKNNTDLYAADISVGFQKQVTLAPSATRDVYFYLAIRSTRADLEATIDTVRGQAGTYWFDQTATAYSNWLNSGKRTGFADAGLNTAFDRALIVIKNIQNPVLGGIPATTNPVAYGYKVWVRDASVSAMSLSATSHYDEAKKYWLFMASVQNTDGTFRTTFDNWTGNAVPFVEPEHDSIGMFLVGAYKHWVASGDTALLNELWPKLRLSADWIQNNIATNGFGAADASIWEEDIEYNAFSQALYVAGLWAAQQMALSQGDQTRADSYAGAASTIASAIQRSYNWSPVGLWNETEGYFNRAVRTDGTPRILPDSSSLALLLYGVLDPASTRSWSHARAIEGMLSRDGYGLARYTGDRYYYNTGFDPAGDEAKGIEPAWPQPAMYMAIYEYWTGRPDLALARITWHASRTAKGYMPVGEAVSWVTQQPLVSTASEPITGASYILAALTYEGRWDTRVRPLSYNSGANKTISIAADGNQEWRQWENVPYFLDQLADTLSGDNRFDISRVYVSNDANNIYIRIDNDAGQLSAFNTAPRFAVHVYSEDFNDGTAPSTSTALYGGRLDRPMQYMAGRWSDSDGFSRFKVVNGSWTWDYNISSLAPQWDPATGRIVLTLPRYSVASGGSSPDGNWAYLDIALVRQDPNTGAWSEDDRIQVNYRLTSPGTAWLYGQEQGPYIQNVSTDKGRYNPGDSVTVSVDVLNASAAPLNGTLTLNFYHLSNSAAPSQSQSIGLSRGGIRRYNFAWTPPTTDYRGYLIDVVLTDAQGREIGRSATAVDVSSDWSKFPRYGFMTFYPEQNPRAASYLIERLNDFHLNGIQFYDWKYKHHVPLAGTTTAPANSWQDVSNRTNFKVAVNSQISAAKSRNMKAMSYNLAFGAWPGYGEDGSGVDYKWGLWKSNNGTNQDYHPLPITWQVDRIYLFNPADTGWQNYINRRQADVYSVYPFDGWHVDQLGDRGTVYDWYGNPVDLANSYDDFLNAVKLAAPDKEVVFNSVAQFGQQQAAASQADLLYAELWPATQPTYNDIRLAVEQNLALGNGRGNVIAAYMNYARAQSFTNSAPGFFNNHSPRLTNATLFASGGSHIELGEGTNMLSNEYFPKLYLRMTSDLHNATRRYYDFLAAYENLLRDGVSPASRQVAVSGVTVSTDAAPGTVWSIVRQKAGYDIVHLINLLSNTSNQWRDDNADYPAPAVQTNKVVRYYYGTGTIQKVWVATPDLSMGLPQTLAYSTGTDAGGNYVELTLPRLEYWDMLVVEVTR